MKLIAFSGRKRNGKSTATKFVIDKYGFVNFYFAEPMKHFLSYYVGITDEYVYGNLKEEPLEILGGKSCRDFYKMMGTEFIREKINVDLWIHILSRFSKKHKYVVIEDVRFPNEYNFIKENNGIVINIINPKIQNKDTHESETYNLPYDEQIINDSTLDVFYNKIDEIIIDRFF